ncbi:MAG TPA: glutamine-hydrolyzing carbamoyl-phosphate synthase small subunit [Candidatus Saccharimonadales bacterium]|nr:glutamine-hydrolyzing carbamoyl-phosphate synthase small subunit [Candidatus Saccharimonadales bacterium]
MKTIVTSRKIAAIKGHPERGDFFKMQASGLCLADGTTFAGFSPAWQTGAYTGEVVFNTGMTGYVESLTDPSYAGQILTFTYPLIGNYGVGSTDTWESPKIHARGVVLGEVCRNFSHAASDRSLLRWFRQQRVPLITGVDTRALTKTLRTHGTMPGVIAADPAYRLPAPSPAVGWVAQVSSPEPVIYNASASKTVILVDCGLKANILRSLVALPIKVKRVPYDYDYTGESFDGVVVSNGPGDPADCPETAAILAKAMRLGKPVFGICLGAQLLALAAGAKTYKLPYGHRGHNQPCIDPISKRCYVTSQNHGYAIDEATLPSDWYVSYRNLNDGSVEGIAHRSRPFRAVQFHPEASPGPTDTSDMFESFYRSL